MNENIQEVLNDIRERLVRVETKIDDIQSLRDKVDKSYNLSSYTKDRLDKLESGQTWLWRSFIGALIVSFVGALIRFNIGG